MSYNGAGVFTRLYNWVTDAGNGINITASRVDADTQDIADGLSNCITKDGQQTITANIPFSGYRITGLGDAVGAQDAVNLRTLQSASSSSYSSGVGGTANAITLTSTITSYVAGQTLSFIVGTTNTSGTVTVSANGVGAKNVLKSIGGALVVLAVGDLQAGGMAFIEYDGTQFILLNPRANSQGADIASASTVNLDTATGDYVHVTGTTTITAITLAQGRQCTVEFTGALTITNGASLINLSGADIVTAAGDIAIFRGEASGVVRMVGYHKATGLPVVAPTVTDAAISTSDITTNNASTSKHGFLKKLSGVATEFLNGSGSFSGLAGAPLSATDITSGTVATARLGSGSASSSTVLYGNNTWASPTITTAGGVGTYAMVKVNSASTQALGSTISGASLSNSDATGNTSGSTLSGTWQCMGYSTSTSSVTLYLRTA